MPALLTDVAAGGLVRPLDDLGAAAAVEAPADRLMALAHGLAMEALDERLPEGEVRPILQIAVD